MYILNIRVRTKMRILLLKELILFLIIRGMKMLKELSGQCDMLKVVGRYAASDPLSEDEK